ncbi:STAS domain-containing protein [Paracoccus sp. S-4012]|uniref:STAS domain-containing protein n=1 Tax=Paracoccus sp. S-4012 TaxID=2665648 RepID=UPI0012B08809|nr:STAS domain-containing protein [Paracoccus sp. S-4012]MRX50702.1 STAS domain-containing protein [Paracoccus sp. S-4012]
MSVGLTLPARLDLTEARRLTRALRDHAGTPLTLDASRVESLGGLGLQVLLAAAQEWRRRGAALDLGPRSAAFDAALAQFGLTPAALQAGGAA